MRYQPNYYLSCRIQDKILNMIGVKPQSKKNWEPDAKRDLKPGELATLAKAFDTLEERKRIIRMKGLPKAVDVAPRRKPARATFTE